MADKPETKVTMSSTGGLTRDANGPLNTCTVERMYNRIWITLEWETGTYRRASIDLPMELAQQISKVILSEADGLWDKWESPLHEASTT